MSTKLSMEMQAMDLQIFEAMPGNCVLLLADDPNYTIVSLTDGYREISGKANEEIIGKGLFDAFPFKEDEVGHLSENILRNSFKTAIDKKSIDQLPLHRYDIMVSPGVFEEKYWSVSNKPVIDEALRVKFIIHSVEDVTEKVKSGTLITKHQELKDAFAQLKESEEKYRNLITTMDQGFCILEMKFDENGQPVDYYFLELNPVFEKQTGLKNAIGKSIKDLVPNLEKQWFQIYGHVALTGEPIHFTEGSDAMERWFEVYAFKIGGEDSRKVALLFTDITVRNKNEKALRQSEQHMRNTVLQTPIAMALLKGPDCVLELANDLMYELWGKSKEELVGKSIWVGLPEARDQGYEEILKRVYTTGERFTAHGIPGNLPRAGGMETIYINLLCEAFREPDGTISGVMIVASDVTKQVTARMEIEASQKEVEFVMDFMPQLIWISQPNGYHSYFNKQWYDYTGLKEEDTKGDGWNKVFHPDDREKARKNWNYSLKTGKPYQIEYRCKRFDGEYHWFLGRALPLKDDKGEIIKWFGTSTDIDDQKRSGEIMEKQVEARTWELKQVNEQLNQFAYSASHDLQEPLRKITYFLERLLNNLGNTLSEDNRKLADRIEHTAERMRGLIDDLLDYSNTTLGATGFQEVSLAEVVQNVQQDMEATIIENNVAINVQHLPTIQGDARQLRQLFHNLLSNAVKYHKKGEQAQVYINTVKVKGIDITIDLPAEFKNKEFYRIEVRDNGIGFDPIYAEKIFKLFNRLHGKAEYAGTGVGLAIAQKVVENHHGYIWANSEPDKGSTFNVLLPIN